MPEPAGLEFKAYEIEELADVYFFRPAGIMFARAARTLHLTPTAVTAVSVVVGAVGAALLYFDDLALAGFALIVLYGVLDSSDGQLARMTGQTTELGRVLDGVGGYAVYAAIYTALVCRSLALGAGASSVGWAALAAIATSVHAQMYDYHRTAYARVAIDGVSGREGASPSAAGWATLVRAYESAQRRLAGAHADVEAAIAARATDGTVRDEDRARYRECFYGPVRGWNLLGDNTRFYALGVLAWVHHLEWFVLFILVPMNAAFAALWLWQARADRRFLAGRADAKRRRAAL